MGIAYQAVVFNVCRGIVIVFCLLAGLAMANAESTPEATVQSTLPEESVDRKHPLNSPPDIEARLRAAMPATEIDTVRPSVLPGVVEVLTPNSVFYADQQGRYLLIGHIYDLYTATDISQAVMDERRQRSAAALTWPEAATLVVGTGSRSLTVLFDPDCHYCRQLYRELQLLKDTAIHLVFYPADLEPSRSAALSQLLCAEEPLTQLQRWMTEGAAVEEATTANTVCVQRTQTAIAQVMQQVSSAGLQGTPTLIRSDGRVAAGYRSAEAIEQWLAQE